MSAESLTGSTTQTLNETEWTVLLALMDAILPSVTRASKAQGDREPGEVRISDTRYDEAITHLRHHTVVLDHVTEQDVEDYLADRPSEHPLFQETLRGMLANLSSDAITSFARVLGQLKYVSSTM